MKTENVAMLFNAEQISDLIKQGQDEANKIVGLINDQIASLPYTALQAFKEELKSRLESYINSKP